MKIEYFAYGNVPNELKQEELEMISACNKLIENFTEKVRGANHAKRGKKEKWIRNEKGFIIN